MSHFLESELRPWGRFDVLLDEKYCKVKQIIVRPGQRLSYQKHFKREELWTVVSGELTVVIDGFESVHQVGDSIHIPKESLHRMINRTNDDVIVIEIQRGDYFGEDDIVRIEDDYSRI